MIRDCGSGRYYCDNMCKYSIQLCDGVNDCFDGADENPTMCQSRSTFVPTHTSDDYPSPTDVVTSIVLPTILACILLVAAMLFGIKKCKQWEFDRIMEMRRTRRVVQRLTARLKEKNFRTLQNMREARNIRKRTAMAQAQQRQQTSTEADPAPNGAGASPRGSNGGPPAYNAEPPFESGTSPPPPYEDALLDEYFYELLPRSSISSSGSRRSAQQRTNTLFAI